MCCAVVPSILLQRGRAVPISEQRIIGTDPSYAIIGGLVFTTLTKEYITASTNLKEMDGNVIDYAEQFQLLGKATLPKSCECERL